MRRFLGIVIGLIVGYLVISGVQMLGHMFYIPPAGIEGLEFDELSKILSNYIKEAPTGALLFVVLSHVLGTFIGVITAMIISQGYKISGSIVGGIFLILTIFILFMLPHPIWMVIIDILAVLGVTFVGLKLVKPAEY